MSFKSVCAALLATATLVSLGCHVPWVNPHEHIAKHQPLFTPASNVLPPAQMLMHPGPGVDGPGPGVLSTPPLPAPMYPIGMSQVGFVSPQGMRVTWDVSYPGAFDSEPLVAPGRFNFPQGAIYRLKVTNVSGRDGLELYPTLEIGPATPRTEAYLAHNFIPFQLTEEDLDQIQAGNFVTKVIYLPDAEYQELALAGVETLVSTRLDPGVDPIIEADRLGSIMAIIRIGNKDLELPVAYDPATGAGYAGYAGPLPMGPAGMPGGPGGPGGPDGSCGSCGGGCGPNGCITGTPNPFVAGTTAPQWGMPITGTPIGLPGPPHIPLGVPAGLQKHVIANHTHMHIPGPTEKIRIDVAQKPGLSYPKPASRAIIVEKTLNPPFHYHQPFADHLQMAPGAGPECEGGCADGQCQAPQGPE